MGDGSRKKVPKNIILTAFKVIAMFLLISHFLGSVKISWARLHKDLESKRCLASRSAELWRPHARHLYKVACTRCLLSRALEIFVQSCVRDLYNATKYACNWMLFPSRTVLFYNNCVIFNRKSAKVNWDLQHCIIQYSLLYVGTNIQVIFLSPCTGRRLIVFLLLLDRILQNDNGRPGMELRYDTNLYADNTCARDRIDKTVNMSNKTAITFFEILDLQLLQHK